MKHFKPSEFACECGCGFDAIDLSLIDILDDVRDHFNAPVIINSGCRCQAHNATVKNSSHRSYHLVGRAADIKVSGVSPADVYAYVSREHPNTLGIIWHKTFVHVDTRLRPYRMGPT